MDRRLYWCIAVEMPSSIRRCERMIAAAGFVHSKGVGFEFQDRMNAFRWFRNARPLEPATVVVHQVRQANPCLPRARNTPTEVAPRKVLPEIAAAIPAEVHPNIIDSLTA